MSNKYLDEKLGKDWHKLPALAKLSEEIIRERGIFRFVMNMNPNSSGISSIHIQKKHWSYARQYSFDGLKMVDGSHDYSNNKVIAIL